MEQIAALLKRMHPSAAAVGCNSRFANYKIPEFLESIYYSMLTLFDNFVRQRQATVPEQLARAPASGRN
jgi:hypothetical protein